MVEMGKSQLEPASVQIYSLCRSKSLWALIISLEQLNPLLKCERPESIQVIYSLPVARFAGLPVEYYCPGTYEPSVCERAFDPEDLSPPRSHK